MTHWRARLRDADPLAAGDPALMPDAEAMRRIVVAAARRVAEPHGEHWLRSALALAATIAVVVFVGATAGTRLAQIERSQSPSRPVPATGVRQLQFATPGGTRIIWTFNPDLNLNESTP